MTRGRKRRGERAVRRSTTKTCERPLRPRISPAAASVIAGSPAPAFASTDLSGAVFEHCRAWEPEPRKAPTFRSPTCGGTVQPLRPLHGVFSRARAYELLLEDCQAQGADFSAPRCTVPHRHPRTPGRLHDAGMQPGLRRPQPLRSLGADLSGSRLVEAMLEDCSLADADLSATELTASAVVGSYSPAPTSRATFNGLDPGDRPHRGRITPEQVPMLLEPLGVILARALSGVTLTSWHPRILRSSPSEPIFNSSTSNMRAEFGGTGPAARSP